MIGTIIKEYGIGWMICRGLYSAKLTLLRHVPRTESLFEKKATVGRLNLLPDTRAAISRSLRQLSQPEKDALLKTADQACRGIIKGFSSIDMDYGMPIQWQRHPFTGKSCRTTDKWYRIPDFDADRGDIKAIWEISRFSHFLTLARAYLISEDKTYYEAFSRQLADWLDQNPYSYGANYKCGQECALRMMNTLLAFHIFYYAGLTNETDEHNVCQLVERSYRRILSNFFYAHRCIRNNHTISELVGMIAGAWCAGDTARMKKAYALLDRVVGEQFMPDGGYTQYSFNYLRLALQVLEFVLCLSEKTGLRLSDGSLSRIQNSALLLYRCQSDGGDVPNYGHNDGALAFPVTACSYRDFRPVAGGVYALTARERLYPAGPYDEEFAWFGGGADISDLPASAQTRTSAAYDDAGLYILRRGDVMAVTVLNDYRFRPAHMDQQHLDLWIGDVNVFCDSGTYSYADPLGEELAKTRSHNTLCVSGIDQMNRRGAFLTYRRTRRRSVDWTPERYGGEMISRNGYRHRRTVEAVGDAFVVCDDVISSAGTAYETRFHTPCKVVADADGLRLFSGEKQLCRLQCTLPYEIHETVCSRYYLKKEPVRCIVYKGVCGATNTSSRLTIHING